MIFKASQDLHGKEPVLHILANTCFTLSFLPLSLWADNGSFLYKIICAFAFSSEKLKSVEALHGLMGSQILWGFVRILFNAKSCPVALIQLIK